MSTNGSLTQKEKELVAIGASIAAGCQPCTTHHFEAVRQAGATESEIRQAVDAALGVRHSATEIMTGLAEMHLGTGGAVEEPRNSSRLLIGELVSIGAALAVNCVTNLETHLQAARQGGATERQIQTALGVARAIKKVAELKAEAITAAVFRNPRIKNRPCPIWGRAGKTNGHGSLFGSLDPGPHLVPQSRRGYLLRQALP